MTHGTLSHKIRVTVGVVHWVDGEISFFRTAVVPVPAALHVGDWCQFRLDVQMMCSLVCK